MTHPISSGTDIAWSSAYPTLVSFMGSYYGDSRIITERWSSLTKYTDNLVSHTKGAGTGTADRNAFPNRRSASAVATCDSFLDWATAGVCDTGMCDEFYSSTCESKQCPVGEMMAGFSYVEGLEAMASMARQLHLPDDVAKYSNLAVAAKQAFHSAFWNETSLSYGSDSTGLQMLTIPALAIAAMPNLEVQARTVGLLRTDLVNRSGQHLQIGAVTSKPYLSMLSQYGLHENALRVATQRTEPGWGYWLAQGATTCWEHWPGDTSRNHIFLCGGFGEWLWKFVVGIQKSSAGFATVSIMPKIDGMYGPSHAAGHFASPKGDIIVEWDRIESGANNSSSGSGGGSGGDGGDAVNITGNDEGAAIRLQVTLPPGVANATVLVPVPFGPHTAAPPEVICGFGSEVGAKVVALNHANNDKAQSPKVVYLECSGGGSISTIDFASFGTSIEPRINSVGAGDDCGVWRNDDGACHANTSLAVVEDLCLHRTRCLIDVNASIFGGDPCPFKIKTLAIRATCTGGMTRAHASKFTVKEGSDMIWDGTSVVAHNISGITSARQVSSGEIEVKVLSGTFQFVAAMLERQAGDA